MRAGELDKLLLENVVRVVFIKRTNGLPRTMVCTKSKRLLESQEGRYKLGWHPASGKLPYNPKQYNLCTVWDIELRDYRHINCDYVRIEKVVSAAQYLNFLKNVK